MGKILQWIHINEIILFWLGTFSAGTFLGTLIVIPLLVLRIPPNYFLREERGTSFFRLRHPILRLFFLLFKNLLGAIFILAGLAMLVLPGQGLITILIGTMLINFPGKYALERWIVQETAALRAINWIRAKAHKPALQVPKPMMSLEKNPEKDSLHL